MFRSPMVPRVRSESLSRGVINGQERRTKERYKDEGGHTLPRSPDEIQLYKQGLLERFRGFTRSTSRRTEREILPDTHTSDAVGPEISRSTPERFTQHELGRQASETEPELPVRAFKEAFLESVAHNQITICTAETGAGKSTQFPEYLLEMGYNVSMTQPRRISASLVAQQVQKELIGVLGDDAEGLVGCHTGGENTITEGKTRITVVTDGLRLVQEFGERDELEHEVLIIDEVHEWNCNIEVLVAQVKRLTKQKPELRIALVMVRLGHRLWIFQDATLKSKGAKRQSRQLLIKQ
jgi:HrpA-like RNA helicase